MGHRSWPILHVGREFRAWKADRLWDVDGIRSRTYIAAVCYTRTTHPGTELDGWPPTLTHCSAGRALVAIQAGVERKDMAVVTSTRK